jgi:hypothetical protein
MLGKNDQCVEFGFVWCFSQNQFQRMDRWCKLRGFGTGFLEGANLMQTNDRVVTRRQALGVAFKALAVVVPVAAVLASSAKSAQAAPTEWRRRWRRRWW